MSGGGGGRSPREGREAGPRLEWRAAPGPAASAAGVLACAGLEEAVPSLERAVNALGMRSSAGWDRRGWPVVGGRLERGVRLGPLSTPYRLEALLVARPSIEPGEQGLRLSSWLAYVLHTGRDGGEGLVDLLRGRRRRVLSASARLLERALLDEGLVVPGTLVVRVAR